MLDILFENPIIIGVVIYFIWTLFKPSKAEKRQQSAPQSVNPEQKRYEHTNSQEMPKKATRTVTPVSPKPEARPKVTLTTSNSSDTVNIDFEGEKKRLEQRKKQAQEALQSLQASPILDSKAYKVNQPSESGSSRIGNPTRKQLREAILWSEILSKPKAKRYSK